MEKNKKEKKIGKKNREERKLTTVQLCTEGLQKSRAEQMVGVLGRGMEEGFRAIFQQGVFDRWGRLCRRCLLKLWSGGRHCVGAEEKNSNAEKRDKLLKGFCNLINGAESLSY